MLLLATGMLLLTRPVAAAGDTGCATLAGLQSQAGDRTPTTAFVDESGQARRLVWIDYERMRVFYADIMAGQTIVQHTFDTHPWLITEAADRCLEIFVATPRDRTVSLQ